MNKLREQFKVHPAADIFPMMSDEELAHLWGESHALWMPGDE